MRRIPAFRSSSLPFWVAINGEYLLPPSLALVGSRRKPSGNARQKPAAARRAGWCGYSMRKERQGQLHRRRPIGHHSRQYRAGNVMANQQVAAWLYPTLESWGMSYDQSHLIGFHHRARLHHLSARGFRGDDSQGARLAASRTGQPVGYPGVMRFFGEGGGNPVSSDGVCAEPDRLRSDADAGHPRFRAKVHPSTPGKELEIATEEVGCHGQLDEGQRILIDNIFEMEDRTAEEYDDLAVQDDGDHAGCIAR